MASYWCSRDPLDPREQREILASPDHREIKDQWDLRETREIQESPENQASTL